MKEEEGGEKVEKARRTKAGGFGRSPWPDHPHPTPEECAEVNRLLTLAHGPRPRPARLVVDSKTPSRSRSVLAASLIANHVYTDSVPGCGEVPCVLDAVCAFYTSVH